MRHYLPPADQQRWLRVLTPALNDRVNNYMWDGLLYYPEDWDFLPQLVPDWVTDQFWERSLQLQWD